LKRLNDTDENKHDCGTACTNWTR